MWQRLGLTLENNLWKMRAVRLFFWMHFFASVLVPFFRDWGGITFTRIFLLNAWFMFWNFLLEIPTGTIADRFGRKTSVALAALVAGVGALVYSSTPRFPVFLCGEVLFATAFTLMSGADEALVYDTLEQLGRSAESKRQFARLESFKLAGIISGALCGSLIAARLGVRAPMLLQALPCLLAFLMALSLVEPGDGHGGARRALAYHELLRSGIRFFRTHAVLRVLAADMVGSATIAWLIIWLYQPQLERVGIGIAFFGIMHAGMCIGQILLLNSIERVEALTGSRTRYLLLSAVVPGVAYLVLALAAGPVPTILAILAAATFGLSRPALFISYMNKYIPSEQRATVLSTVSMLRTLAVAVLNPIAGWLIDHSMAMALAVFGVVAIGLAFVTRVEEDHLID
jgi:MFS family permease